MSDSTTPQDSAAMSPASAGSVDALSVLRKLVDGVRGMTYGDPDDPSSVEASAIVRWAIDEIEQLRGSMEWYRGMLVEAEVKMVMMRLTDAEREAVAECQEWATVADHRSLAATLRGLLERLTWPANGCIEQPEKGR